MRLGGYPVPVVKEQDANIETYLPVKSERMKRIHALGVACVALALLSIAYFLTPSGEGIGTHQQLGLPKCGWVLAADIPCPTCGMTTSWSHTVRGELPTAFMAQPMGMLLAFVAIFIAIGGFITACTGYSFGPLLQRFRPSRIFIFAVVLAIIAWGFKILVYRGVI